MNALFDIKNLKSNYLNIELADVGNDSVLSDSLASAFSYVENFLGRKLVRNTYAYKFVARDIFYHKIKDDTADDVQSVTVTRLHNAETFLAQQAGRYITPSVPFVLSEEYEVEIETGYTTATLPYQIRQAVYELACLNYFNTNASDNRLGLASQARSIAGQAVTVNFTNRFKDVNTLLHPFCIFNH
jgi:hypothetical protein